MTSATADGTRRYAKRFAGKLCAEHFRDESLGLTLSTLGIGTYLGQPDDATDDAYAETVALAVKGGCNIIDTAANYRFQRSERSIGRALQTLAADGFSRDEILICTKGGYIPFDGDVPDDPREYFTKTFIEPDIAGPKDLVRGMHCMTPKYLAHQIGCSLRNMGIETIDVYYVHNAESQLLEINPPQLYDRLSAAFEQLEKEVAAGRIRNYGCATWNALRVGPEEPEHMSLSRMVWIAEKIAGKNHHFKVVQLPFNLRMSEALIAKSQEVDVSAGASAKAEGECICALEAAGRLGLTVFASVPLMQGGVISRPLPDDFRAAMGLRTDAQRALQFVRSTPGIAAPLSGMSRPSHVAENLELAAVPPLDKDQFIALFAPKNS